MESVQKSSHAQKIPDFRRRLQRALSLSSSESEYSQSQTASLSGDTTEEESTHSSGNHQAASQQGDPTNGAQDAAVSIPQLGGFGDRSARDSNILALQCVADLEARIKSLESSMADQSKCIEDLQKQLSDLSHRWDAIYFEVDKMIKTDTVHKLDEPEQKILRTRRSQRAIRSAGGA